MLVNLYVNTLTHIIMLYTALLYVIKKATISDSPSGKFPKFNDYHFVVIETGLEPVRLK